MTLSWVKSSIGLILKFLLPKRFNCISPCVSDEDGTASSSNESEVERKRKKTRVSYTCTHSLHSVIYDFS